MTPIQITVSVLDPQLNCSSKDLIVINCIEEIICDILKDNGIRNTSIISNSTGEPVSLLNKGVTNYAVVSSLVDGICVLSNKSIKLIATDPPSENLSNGDDHEHNY